MLEVRNFSSGYGRTSVLHDIDLVVRPGEIVALIGANGAGKSTLVRTLIGLLPVRSGSIVLTGEPIEALSTTARMRRGLCLVPEGRQIFGGLTIEANLRLGAYVSKVNGDADWESRIQSACKSFPVLLDRRHELAANLSGGQQQMLAIARGLMSGPTLLLLDEPSLGLAPSLVSEIFRLIAELRASGISILLSEQNARRSLAISDRAYVIENGRIVTTAASAELAQRPDIAEAYLGVGHDLRLGDHHLAIAEKLRSILG